MTPRRVLLLLPALLALAGFATPAPAMAQTNQEFAVIYNNSKNDGGFNEMAVRGIARLQAEGAITVREIVIRTAEESERQLRVFAQRGIANLLTIGFINEGAVTRVAKDFPAIRFTIIDGVVDLPNVRSVLFREDEAAYLAGMAAGLASKSGVIGFVGGVPFPPVRRFDCGFVQGVRAVRPDAKLLRKYLSLDDPVVFRDRDLGAKAAAALISQGADIVFPAAGFAGIGTLAEAARSGRLGIGVDTNQNSLHPGHVLTSAEKRVDQAVYLTWKEALRGGWTPGVQGLGMREDGIGWSRDRDNEALVAPFAARIDAAAKAIAAGGVVVEDYEAMGEACAVPAVAG